MQGQSFTPTEAIARRPGSAAPEPPDQASETMTDVDLFGLKDAHVVITGASGGIGLAVVDLFRKLGAKMSAQGNRQTSLLPTSESVTAIKADATNEAEVEAFYKEACSKLGPPDILIGMHPSDLCS